MDASNTNRCFMRFEDRAERVTATQVAETFVSVGPLMDLLESRNNQIIYGRRGTGKTHALRYLEGKKNEIGDISIFIDAQYIGSNGSIYNDNTIPVAERATRLLVDICSTIHSRLLDIFTDPALGWDLSAVIPLMDNFVEGFTHTRVIGNVEEEVGSRVSQSVSSGATITGKFSKSPELIVSATSEGKNSEEGQHRYKISGQEDSWISFQYFSKAIRTLADYLRPKRLWFLIDEWTTIPSEIQPYLADLIRRAMFPVPNITTKIAAIEHRARFKLERPNNGYVGFELGADISASINLDDYLVIDNNEERALDFFRHFVTNHTTAVAEELGISIDPHSIVSSAFTQDNVFMEFVRATEGVPRDAMRILALSAQRANGDKISMPTIRAAAYAFFINEKYTSIQANPANRKLLEWIFDLVIGLRRTRAFLLPVGTSDPIIDRLFDQRALHILNRSRSAAHRPGERFIVYKIDYGLYVDLVATDKFPTGLLVDKEVAEDIDFDVPFDDARSYRRAILELDDFYSEYPDLKSKEDIILIDHSS